jgi:outer membrane protein
MNATMYVKWLLWAACLAGIAPLRAAAAADDCRGPSDDCVAVGHWNFSVALGAGVRTNPLVNGEDIPLVVIPQFSYYGKRFFIDDLDVGFTLAENASNTLSLVASPGYDRVYFYRTDLQNFFIVGFSPSGPAIYTTNMQLATSLGAPQVAPRPRRVTYLAGPEWTFKAGGISGQLDVLHEVTGQNGGDEVRAALGIPLMESKGKLTANVGVTWKSAAIVDYYYGISTIYQGRAALDPFVKLGYTLPLAGKWHFNAFAEYETLGSAIADSPLVAEHHVETVFVGAVYTF